MDVAEEGLLAAVHHGDRAARPQGEHAGVQVHREVLTTAESPADPGEHDPHLLGRQTEARRDLVPVLVDLLARDEQVDSPVGPRERPSPDSGPKKAWSWVPVSYSPSTTKSALEKAASMSP